MRDPAGERYPAGERRVGAENLGGGVCFSLLQRSGLLTGIAVRSVRQCGRELATLLRGDLGLLT